jgi:hypothetical protein
MRVEGRRLLEVPDWIVAGLTWSTGFLVAFFEVLLALLFLFESISSRQPPQTTVAIEEPS